MIMKSNDNEMTSLAADIVSAYVSNNSVPMSDLPGLINNVQKALMSGPAEEPKVQAAPAEPEIEKATTAQIKKSVTPDALISFIDGRPYKTLKRHLSTHGMSAEDYRRTYGLPNDYPMVCKTYSEHRSQLARTLGLGRPRQEAQEDTTKATGKGRGVKKTAQAA
jgi:predicted transcriptional regulator